MVVVATAPVLADEDGLFPEFFEEIGVVDDSVSAVDDTAYDCDNCSDTDCIDCNKSSEPVNDEKPESDNVQGETEFAKLAASAEVAVSDTTIWLYADNLPPEYLSERVTFRVSLLDNDLTGGPYVVGYEYIRYPGTLSSGTITIYDYTTQFSFPAVLCKNGVASVELKDLPHGAEYIFHADFSVTTIPANAGTATLNYVDAAGEPAGSNTASGMATSATELKGTDKFLDTVVFSRRYGTAETYEVIYNTGDATSGNPPMDPNSPYRPGSSVTLLGNEGVPPLAKSDFTVVGWERDYLPLVYLAGTPVYPGDIIFGTGEPHYSIIVKCHPRPGFESSPVVNFETTVRADGYWTCELVGSLLPNPYQNGPITVDYTDDNDFVRIPYEVGETFEMLFNDLNFYPIWGISGPPTNVEAEGGDSKIALLWPDWYADGAVRYEVKHYKTGTEQSLVDALGWYEVLPAMAELHPDMGKHYYIFYSLDNNAEYTFDVRAYDADGKAGLEKRVTCSPVPLGDPGGREADLIAIPGARVIPDAGWGLGGNTTISAHEVGPVLLERSIRFSVLHRDNFDYSSGASLVMYSDLLWTNETDQYFRTTDGGWEDRVLLRLKITSPAGVEKYYIVTVLPEPIT